MNSVREMCWVWLWGKQKIAYNRGAWRDFVLGGGLGAHCASGGSRPPSRCISTITFWALFSCLWCVLTPKFGRWLKWRIFTNSLLQKSVQKEIKRRHCQRFCNEEEVVCMKEMFCKITILLCVALRMIIRTS